MEDSFDAQYNFCVFCYKTIDPLAETIDISTIKTFISQINRHVKNSKESDPIVPNELLKKLSAFDDLLNGCQKCQDKITEFCEKYEMLKIQEIELDWKLDEIVGEINYANKVPDRWKNVGKVLEDRFRKDLEKKTSGENTIRKFRQCVVNAGQQRKKQSIPRVLLKRDFNLDQELILKKTAENIAKLNNQNTEEIVIRKDEEAKRIEQVVARRKFRELYKDKICPKCGKKLMSFKGLQLHLENHKDESEWKFECDDCGRKFPARSELKVHERIHTGQMPYKCPYCNRRYRLRKSYTGHLKYVHADQEDLEEELKKKIITSYEKRKTLMEDKEENLVEMTTFPDDDNEVENMDTNSIDADIEHNSTIADVSGTNIETERNAETFKDPLIQIKYEHSSIPNHNDADLHSLENATSMLPTAKQSYYQNLKNTAEFKCLKCGKSFSQVFHLKTHLEQHKDPSEWKWKCAECNKKFATRGILQRHMQMHLAKKPVECHYCHKKYTMDKYLQTHIRKHHKNADSQDKAKHMERYIKKNPFKCQYCDMRCSLINSLRKHLRVQHSNENIFDLDIMKFGSLYPRERRPQNKNSEFRVECEVCTRKFTTFHKKKLHFKICHYLKADSETETVKCKETGCMAYFLKPNQLEAHVSLEHKNESGKMCTKKRKIKKQVVFPSCKVCGKKCLNNYKLSIHMIVHTKEKKFKCRFCDKEFAYLNNVRIHMRRNHEMDEDSVDLEIEKIKSSGIFKSVKIKKEPTADLGDKGKSCEKSVKTGKGRKAGKVKSGRKKAQFQCQFCDQSYRLEHNLTKHFKEKHLNMVVNEQQVESNLSQNKLDKDANILECEICTREFFSLAKKECHFRKCHDMKGNLEQEIFECEQIGCKAYFLKLFQLRFHRRLEHGDESDKEKLLGQNRGDFECGICKRKYSLKNSYDLHVASHKNRDEWEFGCEKCGKRFLTKAKVKLHMRVHTQEKGYKCKFCGKKFGYVSSLGNHLRANHGDEEEVKVDSKMKKLEKKKAQSKVKIKKEFDDLVESEAEERLNAADDDGESRENEEEEESENLETSKEKMVISEDNTFGRKKESFGSGGFVQLEDLD